jgi:site-specific recombinase XerD
MTESRISLAELVTAFFTRHLAAELNASPHTIVSYRDTFRFLLRHLTESTHRKVSHLTYEDFTPDAILTFLDNLERQRHNSTATRNSRLAAIRSFFSYVMNRDPAAAAPAQKVLSIPFKKAPRRVVGHLSEQELRAILGVPDRSTSSGRRDYLLLALLYDSGARVQELINLRLPTSGSTDSRWCASWEKGEKSESFRWYRQPRNSSVITWTKPTGC